MSNLPAKLEWKGVVKRFGGAPVLDGLDLAVAPGRSLVIIGGSGQGKSVTIKIAIGLMRPDADGVSRKDARDRAVAAMAKVRLSADAANLSPGELSGGMQKRVGLARAIVANPEIIFFDEPTTGLDPITADVINELIVEQVKGLGCTAVSITHDLASARKIGDEIAMLHQGRIIWRGPATEIDVSGNPYVEQFIQGRADGPITASI